MCGRFAFYSPAEATAALFGADNGEEFAPRYNVAPTQDIAAVRVNAEGQNEFALLRWGLVPFWSKDLSIGNRMINARGETVAEKPSFRTAFRKRRCLILADGFYEWRKEDDGKVPYFISPPTAGQWPLPGCGKTGPTSRPGDRCKPARSGRRMPAGSSKRCTIGCR